MIQLAIFTEDVGKKKVFITDIPSTTKTYQKVYIANSSFKS